MFCLWNVLVVYVIEYDIEILFGIVLFYGIDIDVLVFVLFVLSSWYFVLLELCVCVIDGYY